MTNKADNRIFLILIVMMMILTMRITPLANLRTAAAEVHISL